MSRQLMAAGLTLERLTEYTFILFGTVSEGILEGTMNGFYYNIIGQPLVEPKDLPRALDDSGLGVRHPINTND